MSIFNSLFRKSGQVNVSNSNINQNIGGNWFNIICGESAIRQYSSIDLVALNTNYVSICNKLNAHTCASIPLKLYYVNNGKPIEKTPHRKLGKVMQKNIAKSLNIRLKTTNEIVEVEEHPFIDLMDRINEGTNGFDFTSLNQQYLGLIGNSYVRIEVDTKGKPIALYPLLGEYMVVIADNAKDGKISRYEYKLPNTNMVSYKPEEILHFKNVAPGSNILGRAELEECIVAAELYNFALAYESYLSKNNGRPDFAISYKQAINEKDMKEIYKQWQKRFSGVNNSGKPVVTSGEFDVKNLGFNPKDMSYSSMKQFCINAIGNAYGIPAAILDLNSANLASSLTAMQMYKQLNILPRMSQYCQKINERLMPMYDSNLYVWWYDDVLENPNVVTNTVNALGAGIIDRNEARERLGYEVMEEEEKPVKPVAQVEPLDDGMNR